MILSITTIKSTSLYVGEPYYLNTNLKYFSTTFFWGDANISLHLFIQAKTITPLTKKMLHTMCKKESKHLFTNTKLTVKVLGWCFYRF